MELKFKKKITETFDAQDFVGGWMNNVTPKDWKIDFASSFDENVQHKYIDQYISKDLKESPDDFDKELVFEFPSLFQWKLFHRIASNKNDQLNEKFSQSKYFFSLFFYVFIFLKNYFFYYLFFFLPSFFILFLFYLLLFYFSFYF